MLHLILENHVREAVRGIMPDANLETVLVRPCPDPKFGDYQTNALMALAKERKINPRQLATDVLARLHLEAICSKVEIAGAGFLNFKLHPSAIVQVLQQALQGQHLFYQQAKTPRAVVIDFSSPNVAKAMHVGHIRSTILGDALARAMRLLGHRVITDNHIGDWGTQFGMLLVGWKELLDQEALASNAIAELERIYKLSNQRCEEQPAEREKAKAELVKLQNGDPENLAIWKRMIELSQKQFDEVYARLGVCFDHTLGESYYNPRLKPTVEALMAAGIAVESEGAIVVVFPGEPELDAQGNQIKPDAYVVIQKSDGASLYTTTDLATLEYRVQEWDPDEIIYVTDGRQQLHFKQLFLIYRRWRPESRVRLAHVWFGSILGADGKPFRTRDGSTVKLVDLLDEAEERALVVVREKNPELSEADQKEIARVIGIGAVKYADLLPNRQSDYTFSWEKMLSLSGNTVPYLQYAYARSRSIFKKLGAEAMPAVSAELILAAPEEQALARHLLGFGLALEGMTEEYRPNFLCNYLYDLASHFARFYENCPVLKAEGVERASRLALCELTGRVLKSGLEVLGIEVTDRM